MFTLFMRRFCVFSILTAAVAAVSFLTVQRTMSGQGRVAFTAPAVYSVYNRSGEVLLRDELVLAIRGDGSTARVRSHVTIPGNRGAVTKNKIMDFSRAEEVYTDGLTDSITTYPILKKSVESLRRKPSTCTSEDPAVRGTMLGYDVVRVVEDIQASGNMVVRRDEWRAPALDCFSLKSATFRGPTAADVYLSSTTELSSVTVGEPPSQLFERPAGYVERSPSQKRQEFNKRYPERAANLCQSCLQQSDQRGDEVYFSRQSDKGK